MRRHGAREHAPYAVQFQLHNTGTAPVFLHKGCLGHEYGLSSCTSAFRDQITHEVFCACDCASATCTGSLECGACPAPEGTMVVADASLPVAFGGKSFDDVDRGTFNCFRAHDLPPGRYRFAVRVYDSEADAISGVGGRSVTREFALPAATGIVEVPLGLSSDDVCDPTPDRSVAACSGAEARDVSCALAEPIEFALQGGLATWYDADSLVPPTTHTRLRQFNLPPGQPPISCSRRLPRCARDSRVTTTGDVVRALGAPGIAAAFGGNMPVFGSDSRPSDGSILVLTHPDGTSLGLGGACSACPKPLTPAMKTVESVFYSLRDQLGDDPACAALR